MSYLMQAVSREEMVRADPFGGRGVFLEALGKTTAQMLARVTACAGAAVPAVAWGDAGVWVDPGSSGMDAVAFRERWNGGRASEHG
jgi:hypothetical protein